MSREERARQFMPFAALRGFGGMIQEKERVIMPRRELSEESAGRLSAKLAYLERGMKVRVTYYDTDAYSTVEGCVQEIDPIVRCLRMTGMDIPLDDIWCIETEKQQA